MGNQKKRRGKNPPVDEFAPETIRKKRTLPVKDMVILSVLLILQVLLILIMVTYTPKPQDTIRRYEVIVEPLENGTLDVRYDITWTALDETQPLTWVEIGMPVRNYSIYRESISDTIIRSEPYQDEDYYSHRFYLKDSYKGGETVQFSFTINVPNLLMSRKGDYIYEFVPSWFNEIPVEEFIFKWKLSGHVLSHNATSTEDGYAVWRGKLDCGGYVNMAVRYEHAAFNPVIPPVPYKTFDDSGAYNALEEEKFSVGALLGLICLAMVAWEVYIIDGFVSYHRGRGFLRGYGHRVHTYGRVNPHYSRAYRAHNSSSGGGGGRGCACACACACAGGGRAGCSQKNTTALTDFAEAGKATDGEVLSEEE